MAMGGSALFFLHNRTHTRFDVQGSLGHKHPVRCRIFQQPCGNIATLLQYCCWDILWDSLEKVLQSDLFTPPIAACGKWSA